MLALKPHFFSNSKVQQAASRSIFYRMQKSITLIFYRSFSLSLNILTAHSHELS